MVGRHRVTVGSREWLGRRGCRGVDGHDPLRSDGRAVIAVGIDGRMAGLVLMADHLRPDASGLIERLRRAGVSEIAMATGDEPTIATEVARRVGLDRVYAQQTPEGKVELVRALRGRPGHGTVVMVGDGINDAPALAVADVGIAMGTSGSTASSEAADAVIAVDRIDRVAEAVEIGRRSLRIARQSVLVGMGLSGGAMVLAAMGMIPPVGGALLLEGIDLAVILNALRALRG
jgi:P-type E1-E2 ATPase